MDKQTVQRMIDATLNSFSKRIGDTPTDKLQLSNKKYVQGQATSVFSSVQSGLTITGNINVSGSASIGGALYVAANTTLGGGGTVVGGLSAGGARVPQVYTAIVNANGTANAPFPGGTWTSSNTGVGLYQIIHNLGSSNYIIVGNCIDNNFIFRPSILVNNSASIATYNPSTFSLANASFSFTLIN